MKNIDIEGAVLGRVSDAHSGSAIWGPPDDFDPQNQDITDWIEAYVDLFNEEATRKTAHRRCNLRVVINCYSRSRSSFHAAKRLASGLADSLRHNEFTVYDLTDPDDPDPPAVGHVSLHEPSLNDETEKTGKDELQHVMIVVEGVAQQT